MTNLLSTPESYLTGMNALGTTGKFAPMGLCLDVGTLPSTEGLVEILQLCIKKWTAHI